MIRITFILAIISFVASCTSSHSILSRPGEASIDGRISNAYLVELPNGISAYHIECNGLGGSYSNCYKRVNVLCPNGFKLLNTDYSSGSVMAIGDVMGQATQRSIYAQCK